MTTLASMTVRLGIDTDQLRAGAQAAQGHLTNLAKGIAGLGIGVPALAAVAAGVGALVAAFASAGVAVKAFQLAVKPQKAMMQEAAGAADNLAKAEENEARKKALADKLRKSGSDLAATAEKAYQSSRLKTKDAEAAYQRQTAGMPKATAEAALAQSRLKEAHEEWSDSLAGSTMPVYTQGLNLLRRLLPLLTPFVKAAAKAFGDFIGEIDRSTKGKGLEKFAESMAKTGGQNLKNFLGGLRNIAIGIGGIIKAFTPMSSDMSGGFASMTQGFADWGKGLSDSKGFAEFVSLAKQGAEILGTLALAVGKLLVALAPLIGITTMVAVYLAELINALPPWVLENLALAIAAVVLGMKAWRLGAAGVALANSIMASSTWLAIAGWGRMLLFGLMTYARLGAAAVASAARTAAAWLGSALAAIGTWVAAVARAAATAIVQFALMAARAIVWAATMAAQWLIAMGPIGWIILGVIALAALIYTYWDKIKAATIAAWGAIWGGIKWAFTQIYNAFLNFTPVGLMIKHWDTIKQGAVTAWNAIIDWLSKIPGMIYNAFLNFTPIGLMIKHWSAIKQGAITKGTELVNWVRGLPGRISAAIGNLGSLLVDKGRDVVSGLWRGIQSMGGWLRSTLIGWAKNLIPGPIAKALGISSPSKVMAKQVGRWIPAGIIQGAESGQGALDAAMRQMVTVPGMSKAGQPTARAQPAARAVVQFDFGGADSAFKTAITKIVRTKGQGDPGTAFGGAR
ncbi:phage tail protein [Streptomyces sp. 5.8]|uniref:phage tail protein n=1 Tax=Streptomyces sp. 5.8 TaxID=3406571 RepID=UPI003BB7E3C6